MTDNLSPIDRKALSLLSLGPGRLARDGMHEFTHAGARSVRRLGSKGLIFEGAERRVWFLTAKGEDALKAIAKARKAAVRVETMEIIQPPA